MSVFIISNQDGHHLNKQKEWCDGSDNRLLYRAKHKDEAVNIVFELSSKDIWLRAVAHEVELDDKLQPIVTVSDTPVPPQPSEIAAQKKAEAEAAAAGQAELLGENQCDNDGDGEADTSIENDGSEAVSAAEENPNPLENAS